MMNPVVTDVTDTRTDGPTTGGERDVLEHYLDLYRATVFLKIEGLDAEQLCRRSVPPSPMSLAGAVRHLTEVEAYWLREVLDGQDVPDLYSSHEHPEGEWELATPETAADDVARYRAEIERCREITARRPLDTIGKRQRRGNDVNLRWILVHLIEEYARHLGHMDLLRECVDGRTGY